VHPGGRGADTSISEKRLRIILMWVERNIFM
jgi:hypothetical protein